MAIWTSYVHEHARPFLHTLLPPRTLPPAMKRPSYLSAFSDALSTTRLLPMVVSSILPSSISNPRVSSVVQDDSSPELTRSDVLVYLCSISAWRTRKHNLDINASGLGVGGGTRITGTRYRSKSTTGSVLFPPTVHPEKRTLRDTHRLRFPRFPTLISLPVLVDPQGHMYRPSVAG